MSKCPEDERVLQQGRYFDRFLFAGWGKVGDGKRDVEGHSSEHPSDTAALGGLGHEVSPWILQLPAELSLQAHPHGIQLLQQRDQSSTQQ